MRIGTMIGADGANNTLDGIVDVAKRVEAAGLDNVWLANIFGFDAITTLAIIGRETDRIGLGTAVTPTYPQAPYRHCAAGNDHRGGLQKPVYAGYWAVTPGGDRKYDGYVLRQASKAHA